MHEPRSVVAISGAAGLIGRALATLLAERGQRVLKLVRRPIAAEDEAQWDIARGLVEPTQFQGVDAVVHLAGENIAAGRWTRRRMAAIRQSRVDGTRALVSSFSRLKLPPKTLLCASAVGIYGDRGNELLDERSAPGRDFLPEVCQAWEDAALDATRFGTRCVNLRFGVVLSPTGGMLARLLRPFRLGLGGPIGTGNQYLSWIALDDATAAVHHALLDEQLAGPVNIVAPEPVTSAAFARTLGRLLHRPAFLRVPAVVLRITFGQLADEALLASTRVIPGALSDHGYVFKHPRLDDALQHLLGMHPD
jgi:uncharacterized protein